MNDSINSVLLNGFEQCFPQYYTQASNLRERGYSELVFDMPNGVTYVYDQFADAIYIEDRRSKKDPRTKNEWKREFSGRLRRHMRRLHWTQHDLAEELGVTQTTVQHWCSGQTIPSADNAVRIAHALNVPVSDFLDFY